jgi:hypothetical protein
LIVQAIVHSGLSGSGMGSVSAMPPREEQDGNRAQATGGSKIRLVCGGPGKADFHGCPDCM